MKTYTSPRMAFESSGYPQWVSDDGAVAICSLAVEILFGVPDEAELIQIRISKIQPSAREVSLAYICRTGREAAPWYWGTSPAEAMCGEALLDSQDAIVAKMFPRARDGKTYKIFMECWYW